MTGTPDMLSRICRSFRVYWSKADEVEGDEDVRRVETVAGVARVLLLRPRVDEQLPPDAQDAHGLPQGLDSPLRLDAA